MLTNLNKDTLRKVNFLVGNYGEALNISNTPAKAPFNDEILDFLNDVSKELMGNTEAKQYSDVITFAFWIRKASVSRLRERFKSDNLFRLGRGVVFHVAPSNVPVNFAYSLVTGLLSGNVNVVRVPSKNFEQVSIIIDAFGRVLEKQAGIKPYVYLVRYDHDKEINDLFSSIADVRVVWGGDATIAELRKSPLPPRSSEITFADRYSLAVIDSDVYMATDNKAKVAVDFYNDTFFSDQNACTSPRIIVWTGERIEEAKKLFWDEEYKLVKQRYTLRPIQAIDKLTYKYLSAVSFPECIEEESNDNLITRIRVQNVNASLMNEKYNSGFFYEYNCKDIIEIRDLCDDKQCQTIGYIGEKEMFYPLLKMGVKGIDRIVPIGKTMDFDLIWDGYDLPSLMTRVVVMD